MVIIQQEKKIVPSNIEKHVITIKNEKYKINVATCYIKWKITSLSGLMLIYQIYGIIYKVLVYHISSVYFSVMHYIFISVLFNLDIILHNTSLH